MLQFVKRHPKVGPIENLGLALLDRAVWDKTLVRAKLADFEEVSDETLAIYPIWIMFSE